MLHRYQNIFRFVFIIIVTNFYIFGKCIAQDLAGPDVAICLNSSVQLGTCIYDPNNQLTCEWFIKGEQVPFQPGNHNPTVSPTSTTEYILQVTDNNPGGSTDIYNVVVFVIERVDLVVESDITEVMNPQEKPISLVFSADVVVDFPSGFINDPFEFEFKFIQKDIAGRTYSTEEKIEFGFETFMDSPYTLTQLNPNIFLINEAELIVETKVSFMGITCGSNQIRINIFDLDVNQFYCTSFSGLTRQKKAIVGRPITYSATASKYCTNWTWEMPEKNGNERAWNIKPVSSNSFSQSGILEIPVEDLTTGILGFKRVTNDWFGSIYGKVKVTCIDRKGYPYKFEVTVPVYFEPFMTLNGTYVWPHGNDLIAEPLWYLFYKDGGVVRDIEKCSYSGFLSYFETSGHSINHLDPSMDPEPVIGNLALSGTTTTEWIHNLREGKPKEVRGNTNWIPHLAAVIQHEIHHYKYNLPCVTPITHGDRDGIIDTEEDNPTQTLTLGQKFLKTYPDQPSSYNEPSSSSASSLFAPLWTYDDTRTFSCNYADNEARCQMTEYDKYINNTLVYDLSKDWSAYNDNPQW